MDNLKTKYLGLELNSPLIVASSGLTSDIDKLKKAEESGAGAVVLKSLFEEQIKLYGHTMRGGSSYPEADDYISYYTKSHSVDGYLNLIRSAKETLSIPVIPSINCVTDGEWIDFARTIAAAGADALEINAFFLPTSKDMKPDGVEKMYYSLVERVADILDIPVVLKLGYKFSNILYAINQIYKRGARGVVLFNRFFEPDIDIEKMSIEPASVFSTAADRRYVLRSVGMASASDIRIDISASTGVHSGDDAVRYLLAGADTVQVCSLLYHKGVEHLSVMNSEISEWMKRKGFSSVDSFRGSLNYLNFEKPVLYERTQFMKYFSSYE